MKKQLSFNLNIKVNICSTYTHAEGIPGGWVVLMAVVIQEQGSAGNPFETHDKSFILRLQTQTFS